MALAGSCCMASLRRMPFFAVAVGLALCPWDASAFLLGIDLGNQFFKAAVVAPGKPFEIVHNQHSKRKTPTAVSFAEKLRAFGDDAIVGAGKGAKKIPMLFPLQLGRNFTGVPESDYAWLPSRFYPYTLGVNSSGSLRFDLGDASYSIEEVTAHVLGFAKGLAQDALDQAAVSETIITVPSHATIQQRKAVLVAADIARLPRPQLIHMTAGAALQRALDLDLSGENGTQSASNVLFYNMGSRMTEACVVGFRGAKHAGKNTVAMSVLGCAVNEQLGGHQVDLIIAQKMLAAFQAKFPKLAEGIAGSIRALKKLEKEANNLKHVLSANKDAQFRVESLFEDTDFAVPVSRETFEDWCAEVFAEVSKPIEQALAAANITHQALDTVEMIGGGWRIPKVQSLLAEYFQKMRPDVPAMNLSQHINGDEAMAQGAAFYGANSSASFRTKTIYYTDLTPHGYTILLEPLNTSQPHEDGWVRSVDLFPAHSKLRARKTVKLTEDFDLRVTLLENGNRVGIWELAGIHEAATVTYSTLEKPLVSLKMELDSSGIVRMTSATAIFNEPVVAAKASEDLNSTSSGANDTAAGQEGSNASEDAAKTNSSDFNATDSSNSSNTTEPKKPKVLKRKVPLNVEEHCHGISPRPLSSEEKQFAMERLDAMIEADAAIKRVEAAKNTLEAYIYESREKISSDEACMEVSTEDDRTKISEILTGMEDWLYEEEAATATAALLEDKLASLKEHVVPITTRAYEKEQRALLPELIEKVNDYAKSTLAYVKNNMTWVDEKERQSVGNLTDAFTAWFANVSELQEKQPITQDPVYTAYDVKIRLEKIRSESVRLTKIRKIDPMPYSDYGYGGYGRGGYGYDDPRMRAFYENLYKNYSRNGSNFSDWFRNFSDFNSSGYQGSNDSDYWKSFYDRAARNFSKEDAEDGKSEL